jgi:hypothetical protein
MPYLDVPRCQHIKVNGTQCGSPALKRRRFCFFHQRWHEQRIVLNSARARRARPALDLPVLEDANSIQVALMQVMRLILAGQIDPRVSGQMLFALQTASSNLRKTNFEPLRHEHIVIDPRSVKEKLLNEDAWSEDDYMVEYADETEEAAETNP